MMIICHFHLYNATKMLKCLSRNLTCFILKFTSRISHYLSIVYFEFQHYQENVQIHSWFFYMVCVCLCPFFKLLAVNPEKANPKLILFASFALIWPLGLEPISNLTNLYLGLIVTKVANVFCELYFNSSRKLE